MQSSTCKAISIFCTLDRLGTATRRVLTAGIAVGSAVVVAGVAITGTAQVGSAQEGPPRPPSGHPVESPLGRALPALNQQSVWEQDTQYEGPHPDKSKRGVYPVGNGRVFTYMGLGERANTMMAISGPTYAAHRESLPRGHFGELTVDLIGTELPNQKVRRVVDANFVVTSDAANNGLALRTLTFAAPGSSTIHRVLVVHNGTTAPLRNLQLTVRLAGENPATADDGRLVKNYESGRLAYRAIFTLAGGTTKGDRLSHTIAALAAGASFTTTLTISTNQADQAAAAREPQTPAAAVVSAIKAAAATTDWWKNKLQSMPTIRTDHAKVQDLFRDWRILMWTMRDARSGVVSPMVTRRGAYIRESTGPLLTFLRLNMWAAAKQLLDYYYQAARLTGEVREHYPLDLDFRSLEGTTTDWKALRVPESELPSWVVLQHFWYYRATWDAAFIRERQEFLLACLSKQKRSRGSLMRFSGHETYMTPTLYSLDIEKMSSNPRFIAEDPKTGRRSYSLASSVLYLSALQGMGDMVDGIDRLENPKKWAKDPSDVKDKPSQVWLERSLPVMKDIEKNFWTTLPNFAVRDDVDPSFKQYGDDWTGFFAPALSPVNRQPHDEPFANINLLPIWVGFTFASGERTRHNLRNTLGRLWHAKDATGKRTSALVGTTSTVGHFTGDVAGLLLTALIERDGKDRHQAHADLMRIAEPAGEWGRFYDSTGRPIASDDPDWPHRLSPNESGINFDASMFALNGVRHVAIMNFDNRSIKVKLRMPKGAKYLEMNNLKKDNRAINVHMDEYWAPLSQQERKQNDAQQDKRFKRDPTVDHRRFRFRMELLSANPVWGAYQVDADVAGTMFVEYLHRGADGQRFFEKKEFWREDQAQFYIDGSPTKPPTPRQLELQSGANVLVLTNRPRCAEIMADKTVSIVDTGLPLGGPELPRAMLKDGKPTHPFLYLDIGYDAPDQRTFKRTRFWQNPRWQGTLQKFSAAGGTIVRPRYVEGFEVKKADSWQAVAAPGGRLALAPGVKHAVRFAVRCSRKRGDLVLRIGSGGGYRARLNGEEIAQESGQRLPLRDQDAALLELSAGENIIEFEMDAAKHAVLFVQITDPQGLPAKDIR